MNDKPLHVEVPCNGCRACCKGEMIFLLPGDENWYETETTKDRFGHEYTILAHKDNGECIYLGPKGCTIHDRAPQTCRSYDCRVIFTQVNAMGRRRALQLRLISREVMEAARQRTKGMKIEHGD